MKLLTEAIKKATPALYANEGRTPDETPITAKFFTPDSSWTWYMTEMDPEQGLAYGYTRNDAMPDCAELGYFSLEELRTLRGGLGLPVERDRHYGRHTLAEVMAGEMTAR